MKFEKLFFALIISFVVIGNMAGQYRYSAKGSAIYGIPLKHSKNLDSIAKGSIWGGEVDFEWSADGKGEWQHFWRFPSVGVGLGFVGLGNKELLGSAIYAYPYVSVPLLESEYVNWNLKAGLGMAYVTKTWADGDTLRGVDVATANSAFSFPLNFYINGGTSLEFYPIPEFGVVAEAGFSHMSNGSFRNPNFGLNFFYAQLGGKYRFVEDYSRLRANPAYSLPFYFEAKALLSGFSRQINYLDHKNYFVGSLHLGLTFPMTNWYALGGGFDLFYDGVYTERPTAHNPKFDKYLIPENLERNKYRFGVSLNNEIIMGRVVGIIDWGIYLYDPIRNAYPHIDKKRGLFYRYNPKKEDGWNYFRVGLRCRVWDNLVVQVAVKSHLQTAEMLEVGIGYLLPFARPRHSSLNNSLSSYYLYHYDQREATAFPTIWKE